MDLIDRFNTTGTRLYLDGRQEEALDMFLGAAHCLLNVADTDPSNAQGSQVQGLNLNKAIVAALGKNGFHRGPQGMSAFTQHLMHVTSESVGDRTTPAALTVGTPASPTENSAVTEHPFLFNKPLLLSTESADGSFQTFLVTISTILFNLGLVLHSCPVRNMKHRLQRATALYSAAGELLWNNLGCAIRHDPQVSRLYCAIMNNAGYILHETANYAWSRLYFLRLCEFLCLLGPAHTIEDLKDRETFHLNVAILSQNTTAAAAA